MDIKCPEIEKREKEVYKDMNYIFARFNRKKRDGTHVVTLIVTMLVKTIRNLEMANEDFDLGEKENLLSEIESILKNLRSTLH